jgi:hypothetical protein
MLSAGSTIKEAMAATGISRGAISICHTCRAILKTPDSVRHLPLRQRFEAKLRITPGCWLWTAYRNSAGYGTIKSGRTMEFAHRLAYEFYVGPIPPGLYVMHRCDNPSCANPDHLVLGSQLDNIRDMEGKGRARHINGERLPAAKLTEDDVRAIRESAESDDGLAPRFGVSKFAIRDVRSGRTWKHVT